MIEKGQVSNLLNFALKFAKLLILFFVTACSFSPVVIIQDKTYALAPKVNLSPSQDNATATLLVSSIQVPPELDQTGMLYIQNPYQIQYFTAHRWIAPPARLLQPLIIQTLERSGLFQAVVSPPTIGMMTYTLSVSLDKLQQEFNNNDSQVVVAISVTLIKNQTRQIIGHQAFSTVLKAIPATPYGGVVAMNQALSELLEKIVAFCQQQIK